MIDIKKLSTLQYMGCKSRMLNNICIPVIENKSINRVIDLFAGTGCVGYALSPYKSIVSNDLEYYAFVLNEAILNGCLITSKELHSFFKRVERKYQISKNYLSEEISAEECYLSSSLDYFESYAYFSDNTPSVFRNETDILILNNLKEIVSMVKPGNKKQNLPFPCLFTTYYANAYFGIKQCCQIDAIASTIAELKDERQRYVLLAALMTVASSTASSTTHFAQFLTVKSKSTFKNIQEKRRTDIIALFNDILSNFNEEGLLNRPEKKHVCLNLDFEECLQSINIDRHTLVYADPPYFKEHYSRYYHILNTMCLYDYPDLAINPQNKEYTIGRYRSDRKISDFGKRANALSAFQRLINTCADKKAALMISYSENSLVNIEELHQLAKTRYNVSIKRVNLMHSGQGRAAKSKRLVKEFLFQCSLPDNNDNDIEIEQAANRIKGIKPVVDNPGGKIHNYMARKPYNVVSEIINSFSKPGDLVYDPMFGSGTTLIEASKLDRRAIGTDLNPVAYELCSISLQSWDLLRINALIDNFVKEVEESCSNIYEISHDGESRVIERCHFDYTENGFVPTAYWYKIKINDRLSGRKKCNSTPEFLREYELYRRIKLVRIHNHALMPNSRIAIKENATVFSYFCYRNLAALDRIFTILDKYKDEYGYEILRLLVSSSINLIKLSDKKASSQIPYWLPQKDVTSRNAVFIIQQKAVAMKTGLMYLNDNCKSFINNEKVRIYCQSAQSLNRDVLVDGSVDLVLTDPPYMDQVPYLEYNQLWFYLLNMEDRIDLANELVVSDAQVRNKNQKDFDNIFNQIITRASQALKSGGLFVMFYHTFDLKSWSNILTIMHNNGLRYVYQIPTAAPRKSFKTIMSPRSTLDGNYLLFFVKDNNSKIKEFVGDISDAIEMTCSCAERIIRSQERVTTQDLYDQGLLKESFEEGYLFMLSEQFKTFGDVLKKRFKYEDGFWEVL
ncbi:MAG: DNA adenine methylase [Thermoguttaceae bacterium]|nr:DNA adenine methylase [Thermoguttaceae bacterium]